MKYLVAIIVLFALSSAEYFDRPCRTPTELGVKTGFDVSKYIGIWHEIERYDQPSQGNADCVKAEYTLNANGSVNVFNSGIILNNNTRIEGKATAKVSFPNENPLRAMLNVTWSPTREYIFNLFVKRIKIISITEESITNYWVLSTDYISYAFVVNCYERPNNRSFESYWLISRTFTLSDAGRNSSEALKDKFIDRSRIRVTEQDNVKYVVQI
jgi:apolipoprotein D and lipocalin family protein